MQKYHITPKKHSHRFHREVHWTLLCRNLPKARRKTSLATISSRSEPTGWWSKSRRPRDQSVSEARPAQHDLVLSCREVRVLWFTNQSEIFLSCSCFLFKSNLRVQNCCPFLFHNYFFIGDDVDPIVIISPSNSGKDSGLRSGEV